MRFCVDNDSDPKRVAEAVRALRRTVRLGRRAEKALKALEEQGHFDGKVPVFVPAWKEYLAEIHTFPAYQSVSRDDVPDWKSMSLDFGERSENSYGGATFHTVPVYLKGRALCMERDESGLLTGRIVKKLQKAKIYSANLGECRLKSNGAVTFAHRHFKGVVRVRRKIGSSERAQSDALRFAEIVAQCVVKIDRGGPDEYKKIPQHLIDLQAAIPAWLIEDGHVERMFNSMLDTIEIVKVMEI